MSNAFDAARSSVEFKVYKNKKAVFEVVDDGAGIKDLDKIFEPFYTDKKNGTGLGLAIVREAIDVLNGKIEVETSDDGTIFRIIL